MQDKKIDLTKIKKSPKVPVEEREIASSKAVELDRGKETKLDRMLKMLPEKDKFIDLGGRQQTSINTSDYTRALIDIFVEAKKEIDGEKIRKTSYLERYLIRGIKEELKDLGIKID